MREAEDDVSTAPDYWLARARAVRAKAIGMRPLEAKLAMLEVARSYERIADWTLRLQKILAWQDATFGEGGSDP